MKGRRSTLANEVQTILDLSEQGNAGMVFHGMSEEDVVKKVMLAPQPTRRFIQPEEIAEMALYLAGDMARSITGTTISIDGGWTAK